MGQSIQQSEIYALITKQIITRLEEGIIPWRQPWASAGLPQNFSTKRYYKGINVWLLCSLGFKRNLFLTFRQIQGLNARVKKGAKSTPVIFWKRFEKKDEQTLEIKYNSFLRYYSVFNIEQCEGLPESIDLNFESVKNDTIESCESVILSMDNPPEICNSGDEAFYNSELDYINMPMMKNFDNSESYYGTLFHELIHSTGHKRRLNRKEVVEAQLFGSEGYSMEELVAELGACYLKSHVDIEDSFDNSVAYIKHWLNILKDNEKFIIFASAKAQRAVDYILNIKIEDPENGEEVFLNEQSL